MIYFLVGSGGIIGSLLRYYLGVFTHSWWGYNFPLGTLLINLIGCFVLGWFTNKIVRLKQFHPYVLAALGTGLVGSFTTFSTFSVETVILIQHHSAELALLYVLLSLFGGLLMSWLGYEIGYRSFKRIQEKGE
ncbi:fluoride efflux transporter CrcB [Bacillus altitudinis]|uniref:fluoride efflux transporter CrcB n=1 Tax=Bacillus altitudinis TaxID=293387 RepID=UPI003CF2B14C